jgi:D-3-phosphoglycerate dehydrogenase
MTSQTHPSVVVTDARPLLAPALERLEANGISVEVIPEGSTPAEAARHAADSPVVIIGVMPFGADEIAALRATRLIIRAGIGYDMIDVAAASDAGILVANIPDFCVDEVADHTIALLLAAMRRLPEALSTWRTSHSWHVTSQLPPIRRLRGQRLGIVGLGRIGRQVAARATSFGMEAIGFDPLQEPGGAIGEIRVTDLQEVLETSDAISLHCPLTADTRHLLGAESLKTLKPGAIVINTSRGGLVDLEALMQSLDSGHVAVAGLDVLDGEPTPDLDHPLLRHPNVMVTSHVAWYSEEARRELALNTAAEAIRFLGGEQVRGVINRDTVAETASR